MATTRRRRAGSRKQPSSSRAATIFLILVLTGVIIWFIAVGNIGEFIATRILEPLRATATPAGSSAAPGTSPTAEGSAAPAATGAETDARVTGSVQMAGFSAYCIQWGAFSTEENARQAAAAGESRGAVAYILKDGDLYRVLGDACFDKDTAAENRDVYMAYYKTEACLYEMIIPAVGLKVVASQEQIDAMQQAFDAWNAAVRSVEETILAFEDREITADTCVLRLNEYSRDLTAAGETLSSVTGDSSDSPVLTGLLAVLDDSGRALAELSQNKNSQQEVAFLNDLKYNLIDLLTEFQEFAAQTAGS